MESKVKTTIFTAFAIFVFACGLALGQSNAPVRYIKFSGLEDAQTGLSKIYNTMKSNGEDIEKFDDEGKILLWKMEEGVRAILELKIHAEYVNRIVVTKIYGIKYSYKHTDRVKDLVWNANRQLSVGSYSIDSDGELLIQGQISFLETLDLELLEKYCRLFNSLGLSGLTYLDDKAMEIFE